MRYLIPVALLALAACSREPEPAAADNQATPAAPAPTPSPTATTTPALARYIGGYPFDPVGGVAFMENPQVRAAIEAAVPDAEVRERVLDRDVTATPIAEWEGRILSYGCEPHNCGPHNWAVAITPDGARASVCYWDEDRQVARWFPEGAAPPPASGCPSGDE